MLTLTDSAVRQLKKLLEQHGSGCGIRLGVKQTGCSGYAYTIDFEEDSMKPCTMMLHGLQLFIEQEHEPLLVSVSLDYVRDGFQSRFQWNNPNEKGRCGCGESVKL